MLCWNQRLTVLPVVLCVLQKPAKTETCFSILWCMAQEITAACRVESRDLPVLETFPGKHWPPADKYTVCNMLNLFLNMQVSTSSVRHLHTRIFNSTKSNQWRKGIVYSGLNPLVLWHTNTHAHAHKTPPSVLGKQEGLLTGRQNKHGESHYFVSIGD